MPRITGQMKPMPTTVRHEPAPGMCRVPIEMQSVVRPDVLLRIPRRPRTKYPLTRNQDPERNEKPTPQTRISHNRVDQNGVIGARNLLVCRGECTADLWRRRFRLVHRNRGAQRAYPQAAHEPADCELLPRVGGGDLDENSNHEDATLYAHGVSPAKPVGRPTERDGER